MQVAQESAQPKYPIGIQKIGNNEYCYGNVLKTPQTTEPTHKTKSKAANIIVLTLVLKAILYTVNNDSGLAHGCNPCFQRYEDNC
jgi:hypothetical protein